MCQKKHLRPRQQIKNNEINEVIFVGRRKKEGWNRTAIFSYAFLNSIRQNKMFAKRFQSMVGKAKIIHWIVYYLADCLLFAVISLWLLLTSLSINRSYFCLTLDEPEPTLTGVHFCFRWSWGWRDGLQRLHQRRWSLIRSVVQQRWWRYHHNLEAISHWCLKVK